MHSHPAHRATAPRRPPARGLLLAMALAATGTQAATPPPYLDTQRPFDARAADLVSRMTLEEKAAQMQNAAPAIPRLQVPEYDWWNEALHGVARAGGATVFPQAIGLAATFDTPLMAEVATAISDEARAKHHAFLARGEHKRYQGLTFWSPNINIFRDPRWGRGQETYGEDPFLTARMGVTFVQACRRSKGRTASSMPPPSTSPCTAARRPTVITSTCIPASAISTKPICPRSRPWCRKARLPR